jgi:hypothetical protein
LLITSLKWSIGDPMNEVRNASRVGLERCKSCSYFTPRRQPVCANCGTGTTGSADDQPTVTPDQPEVTPHAVAAEAADTPGDAQTPAEGGGGGGDGGGRSKVVIGAIAAVVVLAAIAAGIVALTSGGEQTPEPPTPAPVTTVPVVASSTTTAAPSTTAARPSTTAAASTTAATDALACGRWQDLRYVAKTRPAERAAEIAERATGMQEAAATEKLRTAARDLATAADNHDLNALAAAATAIDDACS